MRATFLPGGKKSLGRSSHRWEDGAEQRVEASTGVTFVRVESGGGLLSELG
jgi:hypothetical protein